MEPYPLMSQLQPAHIVFSNLLEIPGSSDLLIKNLKMFLRKRFLFFSNYLEQ